MTIGCPTTAALDLYVNAGGGDHEIQGHLAVCPACRERAERFRLDQDLVDELIDACNHAPGAGETAPRGYTLLEEVHRGGQGVVHRARRDAGGGEVALKLLLDGALASRARRARFQREIEVVRTLEHPGIVQLLDHGETDDGRLWLATEFVEGVTIDRVDDREPRAVAERMAAVCEAVGHAHARGVLHRDLKPGNLIVDRTGRPRVVDFGLAKELEPVRAEEERLTRTGAFLGTLAYSAPEQVSGQPEDVDVRTDVYALGVVLYEQLGGALPYPPDGSVRGWVAAICEQDPQPLPASVDHDLATIARKALAKDPERRYQTAGDLGRDLRRWLTGRAIDARRDSTWYLMRNALRRHRGSAAMVAGLLGVALVAGFLVADSWRRAANAADQTRARDETLLGLADGHALDLLKAEVPALYPARPERVVEYDAWLARAEDLLGRLPAHRATLDDIRTRAGVAWDLSESARDWWHGELEELVHELEWLESDEGHLLEVRVLRDFALSVEERTLTSPESERRWSEVIDAIAAHPDYRLRIAPQLGLVPVGPDPDSGLFEFAHVETGEVPLRDPDSGALVFGPESAVVLVLLPGGRFLMGGQTEDPDRPNYDPWADADEVPVHEVELAPFFVSKYEMSVAQWERVTGEVPNGVRPGMHSGSYEVGWTGPVERIDWHRAGERMRRLGLALPTEAQWEYAARGGSSGVWWSGDTRDELAGAANVADETAGEAGAQWSQIADWPGYHDGYPVTAPVDTMRANPFGLHHVHGNVNEWCQDWFAFYTQPVAVGSGERSPDRMEHKVFRGGGFSNSAPQARSAQRKLVYATYESNALGVRPARAVEGAVELLASSSQSASSKAGSGGPSQATTR